MTQIIARSRSTGGDNGYSMECGGNIVSFATCQHIIRAAAEKRLVGFESCIASLKAKACPAIKMMLEEKAAGRALYFKEYGILVKLREQPPQKTMFQELKELMGKPDLGSADNFVEFDISKIVEKTLTN